MIHVNIGGPYRMAVRPAHKHRKKLLASRHRRSACHDRDSSGSGNNAPQVVRARSSVVCSTDRSRASQVVASSSRIHHLRLGYRTGAPTDDGRCISHAQRRKLVRYLEMPCSAAPRPHGDPVMEITFLSAVCRGDAGSPIDRVNLRFETSLQGTQSAGSCNETG